LSTLRLNGNFEISGIYRKSLILMVARGRIELPTRGFSVTQLKNKLLILI
jgi:hypothetical protein